VEGAVEEAGEVPVIIEPNAAILAAQHLAEQGRGHGQTAKSIAVKVQGIVENKWGTAKVPRFSDDEGGGWLIDVSNAFDGEVMYAVVRSKGGQRTVTHIVEEDDAVSLTRGGQPPEPDDEDELVKAVEEGEPQPFVPEDEDDGVGHLPPIDVLKQKDTLSDQLARKVAQNNGLMEKVDRLNQRLDHAKATIEKLRSKPEDDALLRFDERTGDSEQWTERFIKVASIEDEIQALLAKGVKAENIEVWTRRQRPRVKVELE
jgi:hypothetical protein